MGEGVFVCRFTVASVLHKRPSWLIGPISPAAEGPLYQQIFDRLKREVSEGRLQPGAALPSFRQLAEDLLVSVITVKRAYEELERDGIIFRRQGLGTFVSEQGHDRSRETKLAAAKELLRDGFREAVEAGLKPSELAGLARRGFYRDWDNAYCAELMRAFDLSDTDPVATLSFGARTKLSLLLALARRPELLIMDEPLTGLDTVSKQQVFGELLKAVKEGSGRF